MAMYKIDHSGFHGRVSCRFRGEGMPGPCARVEVSARVAKRLNSAVCGMKDCKCGEYIAYSETEQRSTGDVTRWYVSI